MEQALGQVPEFEFANGNGTVEGWIQAGWTASSAGYNPCPFAARDGGSIWSIHMTDSKTAIGDWNSDRYDTFALPGASGWHHLAVAFGGGKLTMYWDGKSLGTIPHGVNLASGKSTQIGSSAPATTAEGWIGNLDEVAFYSTPLDAATIWNHFLAMVGAKTAAPTLSISRPGTQVTLSWPSELTGFTLEYSDSLPGTTWAPVDGVVGNSVTVDASVGNRFYRLRK